MDLLKTPSVQSLLDSDLESVASLHYLDIEELDEVEYALPASEAPSLAEVLSIDEDIEEKADSVERENNIDEPATCSALQVDFLQGVSQQMLQAHERSSAGAATTLSVGKEGRLTVGTAHGHILSFHDQTLRWVCDVNVEHGAVSCLAYNHDGTRLLAGYARGLICQYESIRGVVLRRVTLGGELWGTLRVSWAGTSGLALDTGGSVWLIKFSRPLGVRTARASCLFSGARGEVVAMTARDARVLALATLSRVIIVAGGRASGVRLGGPPDTLPALVWSESDATTLVCARSKTLQWLTVNITGTAISLRPIRRLELKTTPLWLGWLGGSLAIFDGDENLRLVGEDYGKPLDLSHVEPIYASAFFKGHWTDGRVSRAMYKAGASALGGACVCDGALSLLGRQGVVRVKLRDVIGRAKAFRAAGRHLHALRILNTTTGSEAKTMVKDYVADLAETPHALSNKRVADEVVSLCIKFDLSEELWTNILEQCSNVKAFVEALGDAVIRGDVTKSPPSPDATQLLIERLAELEPSLVERVIASMPLTSLDPHRASVLARDRGLWRGVGAIAAALGGSTAAMVSLVGAVRAGCGGGGGGGGGGGACSCAGGALLLAAADALAGRGAGGAELPQHARPAARHDALRTLLADHVQGGENSISGSPAPLLVLVQHETSSAIRLLEQSSHEPPFVGPLGKHNRMRVAKALLSYTKDLERAEDKLEIVEFLCAQLQAGALAQEAALVGALRALAASLPGARADLALLALAAAPPPSHDQLEMALAGATGRPRVQLRLAAALGRAEALQHYAELDAPDAADVAAAVGVLRTQPALLEAALAAPPAAAVPLAAALLAAGALPAAAALQHLRTLCRHEPGAARAFLRDHPGLVTPEDALAAVRELGPPDAEPACLEAVGDASAALALLLDRAALEADAAGRAALLLQAGETCARAARSAPPAAAAEMWARLARSAGDAPPAELLRGAAFLPPELLARLACESVALARGVLEAGARLRLLWACAARVSGRERHAALARALAAAGRGAAARGACVACGAGLARCGGVCPGRGDVCTGHCARAWHAACGGEARCGGCGARGPLPAAPRPRPAPPAPAHHPYDHTLSLLAPPRPDLEGIV